MEDWFIQIIDKLKELLPRIFTFIAVLIVAYIVGRLIARIIVTLLRKLEFERLTKKSEAEKIARRFGMSLIGLIEVVTRWTIYLIGLQIAAQTAGLELINDLMAKIVNYMPNLIWAVLIFIVGILVAEKLGNFVQSITEDEKSQLGISTGVLIIVTGSIFISLGLLLVVGLRDLAPNVTAGLHLIYEKTFNVGDTIQIGEHTGIVEDIGMVKSIVKKENGDYVVIPNSTLLKSIIIKKEE
ncbi:MAG: mechanosensitive ion channel [Theionarchaea archaeon]|nr:mechanosensitive ion channel [Theionarchaea archaeon]